MPRYTVTLSTTVGFTTRQTQVLIEASDDTAAIARADELAALDKSGRTEWSEINPVRSIQTGEQA